MSTRTKWTSKQEEYLIANYETMSPRDIATYLGVAKKSVYTKARSIGLRRPVAPPKPKSVPKPRVRRQFPAHLKEMLFDGVL